MKLTSRNLLCALGLITLLSSRSYAADLSVQNSEQLESQFVQIEVSNTNAYSVSVLKTFQNLASFVQTRYYSLLNWGLRTRGTVEVSNYDRKGQFGRWVNDPNDETCYNTRAKVLIRDSSEATVLKPNSKCVIAQGDWKDPYTGDDFTEARDIQIDHLVPLKNAYLSGAFAWPFRARCLYANYLGYNFHLLAVSGSENMRKSDKGPDKYMPPNENYACTYVRNWLTVKMLWGLTMTTSEANAIRQVILDYNCSTASFRVTEAQLNQQRKFAQDNMDLCEKMDVPAVSKP